MPSDTSCGAALPATALGFAEHQLPTEAYRAAHPAVITGQSADADCAVEEVPWPIERAVIDFRRNYDGSNDPCSYLEQMGPSLASKLKEHADTSVSRQLAEQAIISALDEFTARNRLIPSDGKRILQAAMGERPVRFVATTLPFVSPTQWEGQPVPKQEWLVDQVIPMAVPSLLSGDGGVGKTTIMGQLAVAVATGAAQWLGWKINTSGAVIYFSAEESVEEFRRRAAVAAEHYNARLGDLHDLHVLCMPGEDATLGQITHSNCGLVATELFRNIEAVAMTIRPALVAIEAAADVFNGNENDRAQVRQFVGLLRNLAIKTGAAIVLLAHPSLQGLASGTGTSGSTGWNNSMRSRLYMSVVGRRAGEADPALRELMVKKANYGPTGQKIRLRWSRGVFIIERDAPAREVAAAEAHVDQLYLKCLDIRNAQGRPVSHKPGANYAPAAFAEMPEASGVRSSAFAHAQERLFSTGAITVERTGPASRQRNVIVRASGGIE